MKGRIGMRDYSRSLFLVIFLLGVFSCKPKTQPVVWKHKEVTVSAYNSVASQTDAQPSIAAWGDTLRPGMQCVAVSRDLLAVGLDYDTPIKIEGLEGTYLVKDKMHPRWKNRMDIYMGNDVKSAKEWGKKTLRISYPVSTDSLKTAPNR